MPEFAWRAVGQGGKETTGRTTAATPLQVQQQLRREGLVPVEIAVAVEGGGGAASGSARMMWRPAGRKSRGPVTAADVLALSAELSVMLKAGLALDKALRVLIDMSHKPAVSALLTKILEDMKGGSALSVALSRHRALFGDFYINMVRSGEASGQLSEVLARLVEHMERVRSLRESVVSAVMYPAILLVVAALSLVVMLGFVVPQFEKLFQDMGDALPLPTQVVMHLGHSFSRYGLVLGLGAAVTAWWLRRWLTSPSGRAWWGARALRIPVLGRLVWRYQLTLFARSLGTLLGNGVPMIAALRIASDTVSSVVLRKPLEDVVPVVKEGGRLVNALMATGIFEPLAINLIRVGEETGRIGPMMLELAHILNREVETGIKRALTLVEPILILVLGVMIAAIIVSLLMGILSVNDLAA